MKPTPVRSSPATPTPVRQASTRPPRVVEPSRRQASGNGSDDQIAEIEFKGLRRDYFRYEGEVPLSVREWVVVDVERGQDLGCVKRVAHASDLACEGGCDHTGHRSVLGPSSTVARRAAPADVLRLFGLREQEPEVRTRTRAMVQHRGLRMKVSEAEWQWDRSKLTVYFTAERRVDFRQLVRDMARTFRARIELRQIGVRDEARRLGGLGRCRRELCCRSWLDKIEPVTLQLAKDQNLLVNPSHISGACGRLMNCLRYEHEAYMQAKRRFPAVGKDIRTRKGLERVLEWSHFDENVVLRSQDGDVRTVLLADLKAERREARRADLRTGNSIPRR